jgi:hypothetical protein
MQYGNLDLNSLVRKAWISDREFHRAQFQRLKKTLTEVFEYIS